jgi:hypothetical protein
MLTDSQVDTLRRQYNGCSLEQARALYRALCAPLELPEIGAKKMTSKASAELVSGITPHDYYELYMSGDEGSVVESTKAVLASLGITVG